MVDTLFLGIAVLTIVSAIAALEMRSLIYGGLALMGTLGGIAGFFILLDSPFVALFQIAVYVGSTHSWRASFPLGTPVVQAFHQC